MFLDILNYVLHSATALSGVDDMDSNIKTKKIQLKSTFNPTRNITMHHSALVSLLLVCSLRAASARNLRRRQLSAAACGTNAVCEAGYEEWVDYDCNGFEKDTTEWADISQCHGACDSDSRAGAAPSAAGAAFGAAAGLEPPHPILHVLM